MNFFLLNADVKFIFVYLEGAKIYCFSSFQARAVKKKIYARNRIRIYSRVCLRFCELTQINNQYIGIRRMRERRGFSWDVETRIRIITVGNLFKF